MFISLCFSSLFFQAMFDYSKPVVNYESGHQLDNSRSRNQCQTTRPRQSAHSSLMGRTSMHFWKEDVSFQAESLEIVATLSNNCPNCPVGASLRFFRVDWHSFRWEPIFGNTGCSPMMIGADLSPKISASVYLQHHSLILPSCVCVWLSHIHIIHPHGSGLQYPLVFFWLNSHFSGLWRPMFSGYSSFIPTCYGFHIAGLTAIAHCLEARVFNQLAALQKVCCEVDPCRFVKVP